MPGIQDELKTYGTALLKYATAQVKDIPSFPLKNTLAEQILTKGEAVPPGSPLQTLFTQLDSHYGPAKAESAYFSMAPLMGKREIFPNAERPSFTPDKLKKHWTDFESEKFKPKENEKGEESFEAFCYRLRRYAWCLPAPYYGEDISLYEYFKLVAALRYCEAGGEELVAVSGDIAGIQNWLYTIQSSKTAQTLRGRSFYLQLISDGIARRLLHRFDVPRTNLIYQGGGNFSLLLPGKLNGEATEDILQEEKKQLEQTLWNDYGGDLSLSLAWVKTNVAKFLDSNDNKNLYEEDLKPRLLRSRATRFTTLDYNTLFVDPDNLGKPEETKWRYIAPNESDEEREIRLTKPNRPYLDLARELNEANKKENREQAWLVITPTGPTRVTQTSKDEEEKEPWFATLERLTQHRYKFVTEKPSQNKNSSIYAINRTEGIFKQGADGFIFIGNFIPRVSKQDEIEYEQWLATLSADERAKEEENQPVEGEIRDFGLLAKSARGIQRYGVLRIDVDNLGKKIFRSWLPPQPGPLARATMSSLLGLFFESYLNQICEEINEKTQEERGDTLYLIYSGGDDLFVVGAWDRLPELAVEIREKFKDYTCNSKVTISGGISVADSKSYPLYQAADDAKDAEEAAKHRENGKKDALSFLRVPLGWDEFNKVAEYCQKLVDLTEKKGGGRPEAPRALLTNLLDLDRQARYGAATANKAGLDQPPQLETGRWYWRAAYNLKRTMQRVEDRAVRQRIEEISDAALKEGRLQLVGLTARWTHLLTRTSQED